MKIVPLQAMPATMEALKGKQVDAILVPQPFPGAAEAQGFGKIIAWAGDLYPVADRDHLLLEEASPPIAPARSRS